MGETNFNLMNNTDFLKKLSGQDLVRAEFKGKNCFDFRNYAKLIMATNSLPPTADKTMGFYRRWKIIDFPNEFNKEENVLKNIPEEEYKNLSFRCLNIAKKLWDNRIFTNDGDFEDRKRNYEEKSNPLMKFLKDNYEKNVNGQILFGEFYDSFIEYLESRGMRVLSSPAVSKQLKAEGFETKHMSKDNLKGKFIIGVLPRKEGSSNSSNRSNPTLISMPYARTSVELGNLGNLGYFGENKKNFEDSVEYVKILDIEESKENNETKENFKKKMEAFGF